MNGMKDAKKLGMDEVEKPETIIIDYGGANVAKPLHVGHLRSAVIGEALKRMGRFVGHKVIGDVHLGDWGLQMGLIIEELKDRKPELPYFDPNFKGSIRRRHRLRSLSLRRSTRRRAESPRWMRRSRSVRRRQLSSFRVDMRRIVRSGSTS